MLKRLNNTLIPINIVLASIAIFAGKLSAADSTDSVAESFAAFSRAFQSADIETLDQMLTDDYVHTNTGAPPLNKKAWLRWLESRRADISSGDYVFESYEIEDLEIVLYDSAAVVTGVVHIKGINHKEPFNRRIRFTNLWISAGGVWRRAAFHDAPAS